ncbi:hypothetical protein B0E43_14040 [Algoriphagus sp. A40]|nr:hypothetical protein B0E43_14040 [Algoriphagus sp. A40]
MTRLNRIKFAKWKSDLLFIFQQKRDIGWYYSQNSLGKKVMDWIIFLQLLSRKLKTTRSYFQLFSL